MKYYLLSFLVFLLTGCQLINGKSENSIDEPLTNWADAYFNFHYQDALEYMTPESGKWIRFAASNITEQDVEFIKNQDKNAHVEIIERHMMAGDTTCSARISVSNFIELGGFGQENKQVDNAEFQVILVHRDGKWLVKMEGLPRNEM